MKVQGRKYREHGKQSELEGNNPGEEERPFIFSTDSFRSNVNA